MITRENYEIYFVDFLDGNLSTNLKKELIAFLKDNPDLKIELDLVSEFTLPDSNCEYSDKSQLYKSELDDEELFNQTAISIIENDATPDKTKEFEQYLISNPAKQNDFELFKKVSKLTAPTISYPHKSKLYKRHIPLVWWQRAASVAAVAILFISISYFFNENTSPVTEQPQPIATNLDKLPKEQPEKSSVSPEKTKVEDKVVVKPKAVIKSKPNRKKEIDSYPPLKKLSGLRPQLQALNKDISIQFIEPVEFPNQEYQPHFTARLNRLKENILDNSIAKVVQTEKIKKTVWKTIAAVSGERFIIYEDENGKVRKISYDSDFLAVSIPVKN